MTKKSLYGLVIGVPLMMPTIASADGYWHNGRWHSCWGCGGIGPGAAVGLGLGAFALGALVTNPPWWQPRPYVPPYYAAPLRQCWNGIGYYYC